MADPTMHTDIHEFVCMYTPSLTQKKKDWHDGFIKWHTHNYRTALYDINRNPVCFKFFPGKTIEADSELNFDRYLVEVKEQTDTMQANLENVIRKPTNTPVRQAVLARRAAGSIAGTLNTPAPRTPLYGAPSKRIYPPCMSQTPLHARHIAVEPRVMVPITVSVSARQRHDPKSAPLPAMRMRKLDGILSQKESVLVQRTLPRTPAAQSRPLMPSSVKPRSALGQANRNRVASPSRSPSSSPEPVPKARLKAKKTAAKITTPAAPASIKRPTASVTEPISIDLDDDDDAHQQADIPPGRPEEAPQLRRTDAAADPVVRIVSLTRKKRCLLSALKPKPAAGSSPRSPPRVRSASPQNDAVASFAPSLEHARSPSPIVQAPAESPDCVMLTSAPRSAVKALRNSPESSLEVLSRPVAALAKSAKLPCSPPKAKRNSPDPSLQNLSLPAAPDGLLSRAERLAEHREKQRLAMEAALALGRETGLLSAEPGPQTGAVDADEAFEKAWEAFEADETQDAPVDIENTGGDVHAVELPNEEHMVIPDAQDVADAEAEDADEADNWAAIQGVRSEGFSQFVEKLLSSQGQSKLSSAEAADDASRRAVDVAFEDDHSEECPATAPEAIQPMVPETDLMDLQQDTLSIPCTAVPSSNTRHADAMQAQAARDVVRDQFKHLLAAAPVAVLHKTVETDEDGFLLQSERKRKRSSPAKSKKKKRLQMTVVEAVEKPAGKFDHLLAGYQFSQQQLSQQADDGWQIPLATAPVQQQDAEAERVEQIGQETDEDDENMDTTQERHVQQHLNAAARRIAAQSTLSRLNPQHNRGQARKKAAGKALHTFSRERLLAAAVGHPGQQGPIAQVQASVPSRPSLADRHALQEADEQSVNAMRSVTAVTDGNIEKGNAPQAPASKVVRHSLPARRALHHIDDDNDLTPALPQVQKPLSVSIAAASAAPPPRIRTGLWRQGSLLPRPTSAKSITAAPMPVPDTLEHEAGVILATQLARRAPDFMSAKSHHAGAVLGFDAPLAALKGMSARDLAAMTDCTQEMADA